MIRPKSKQIPIGFTDRHREMISEIMQAKGYPSIASVAQQAIIDMHSSIFKDYVMAKRSRSEQTGEGLSGIAEKKSQQTDKLMAIVKKLNGEVVKKGGVMMVEYYTYNRKNRYKQETPLETMADILVEKQYFPSKAEVLQLQKEGKTNY